MRNPPATGPEHAKRTSENFPLSVHLLFHGIECHGKIAVRTHQHDRLGRLAVDDMQLGKPSHAPRTVYRLVKGFHDGHKILWAAILRLNLWTGQGKGCGCILLAKGFELTFDDSPNGHAVISRKLPLVGTGGQG